MVYKKVKKNPKKKSSINYELIKRSKIFSNSRFNIFSDRLLMNNGQHINDHIIIKPKVTTEENIVGINILPVFENKFYLMKVWRHHFNDYILQSPTGFIELNENPRIAALRELSEETSFKCGEKDLVSMGSFVPDAGLIEGKVALFLALNCFESSKTQLDEIGTGELVGFNKNEFISILQSESNIGGSTIAAGLRSLKYL